MTMSCKVNPHIQEWIDIVRNQTYPCCEDQKLLVAYVEKCFETEDIYTDAEQLEKYLGLLKYFPYDQTFPWQKFVIGLHCCTYWSKTGMPRWPDLFCMLGRGAGKDGTIAWESVCLMSPYNGIASYDIDICANNEDQALRPMKDVIEAFEQPRHIKKMKKFFYWTKEKVQSIKTKSVMKGRTNSPKGKDGLRSGAVIFNEIHQYEDYKNINVFTTGLGKKKHPRRAYYTTNGDVREGPLDDLITVSEEILREGAPDNGLLPFLCRLDSKEEVHDEKNWSKSNPSLPYLPHLLEEIRKEYREWKEHPERLSAFMTKRMNIPSGATEVAVTDYANILATKEIEMVSLRKWSCVVGIDYSKITDFASVNAHFKDGDLRYDLNHSWLCLESKDIPRMKCPWKEWSERGLITPVDEPEIHPKLLTDYITDLKREYDVKMVALDDFRFALLSDALKEIGFNDRAYKNVKLVRPSDIMRVAPIIDRCFANHWFCWGDNPVLRWATNNTKLVRSNRKIGSEQDADMGNFVYGKIEAKSRKTDPFMALVAGMTVEGILTAPRKPRPKIGVYTY